MATVISQKTLEFVWEAIEDFDIKPKRVPELLVAQNELRQYFTENHAPQQEVPNDAPAAPETADADVIPLFPDTADESPTPDTDAPG